ncbi:MULTISPECIES: hypothetical protein [Phaeobacter]|uniref:Uncharacterized protein n=1 Tax=Phaeobacter porticola TaxID=1844006 RepID=A0A1L3IBE1_9RHOB|nr:MULTISPECIES: hypothetical protein [Phaeobacter]APG49388.1 hypothetical protein PhaeoP97_04038 [Phaeobacter porticola]
MNKVTHESLTQGPPAPVAPTQASIGAAALATQERRSSYTTASAQNSDDGEPVPASQTPAETGLESPTDTIETDSTGTSPAKTAAPAAGPAGQSDPSQVGELAEGSSGGPQAQPTSAAGLAPADLDQLAAHLRGGSQPLAGRGDLIELHKRITAMFATLNDGLGEMYTQKAAADRKALNARIDTLEEAVNRMEGALRIELEPVLRKSFAKVIAEQSNTGRGLRQRLAGAVSRGGFLALILALGLAAGTLYHSRIASAASTAWAEAQIHWASFADFVETTTADPDPQRDEIISD